MPSGVAEAMTQATGSPLAGVADAVPGGAHVLAGQAVQAGDDELVAVVVDGGLKGGRDLVAAGTGGCGLELLLGVTQLAKQGLPRAR